MKRLIIFILYINICSCVINITPNNVTRYLYTDELNTYSENININNIGTNDITIINFQGLNNSNIINLDDSSLPLILSSGNSISIGLTMNSFYLSTGSYNISYEIQSSENNILFTINVYILGGFNIGISNIYNIPPSVLTYASYLSSQMNEGNQLYLWYKPRSNFHSPLTIKAMSNNNNELSLSPDTQVIYSNRTLSSSNVLISSSYFINITSLVNSNYYLGDRFVNISLYTQTNEYGYNKYQSNPFCIINIRIRDNNTPNVLFSLNPLVLQLLEGTETTLAVTLGAQPLQSVQINWPIDNYVKIEPSTSAFTTNNWNQAKILRIQVPNNLEIHGYINRSLTLLSPSCTSCIVTNDVSFSNIQQTSVLYVSIIDNDLEFDSIHPTLGAPQGGTRVLVTFPSTVTFFRSTSNSIITKTQLPRLQCIFKDQFNEMSTVAVLKGSRTVECYSPVCNAGPVGVSECISPAYVYVNVNGQRSQLAGTARAFKYYDTPTITRILPNEGDIEDSLPITIVGTNYLDISSAVCRIGPIVVKATKSSYTALNKITWDAYICDAPTRMDLVGQKGLVAQDVAISLDGQTYYSNNNVKFNYFDSDLEATNSYWLWFWILFNIVLLLFISLFLWDCCLRVSRVNKQNKWEQHGNTDFGGPAYLLKEAVDWSIQTMFKNGDDWRLHISLCEILEKCLVNGETKRRMLIPHTVLKENDDNDNIDKKDIELSFMYNPGKLLNRFRTSINEEKENFTVYGIEIIMDCLIRFCLPNFSNFVEFKGDIPSQYTRFTSKFGTTFESSVAINQNIQRRQTFLQNEVGNDADMNLLKMMTRYSVNASTFTGLSTQSEITTSAQIDLACLICTIITACTSENAEFRSKVHSLMGINIFISLIEQFPQSASVCESSLMTLTSIVIYTDKNRIDVGRIKELILNICLGNHSNHSGVNKWGTILLSFLNQ